MVWEVELKLAADLDRISMRLKAEGAEFVRMDEHHDLYFQHPQRDFNRTDEAMRIRQNGNETTLTYKGPKIGATGKVREELECVVAAGEDLTRIIEALGFQVAGCVRKKRSIWRLEGTTLALDQVAGLGDFIEMERVVHEGSEQEEALSDLLRLAERLGLDPDQEIRKSYLELLMEKSAQ